MASQPSAPSAPPGPTTSTFVRDVRRPVGDREVPLRGNAERFPILPPDRLIVDIAVSAYITIVMGKLQRLNLSDRRRLFADGEPTSSVPRSVLKSVVMGFISS